MKFYPNNGFVVDLKSNDQQTIYFVAVIEAIQAKIFNLKLVLRLNFQFLQFDGKWYNNFCRLCSFLTQIKIDRAIALAIFIAR